MATTSGQTVPRFTRGDRLRKAREHAGLGTEELAAELGVSRYTIHNWERDRPMKRHALLQWASITNVPVEWLERGDYLPEPSTEWYGGHRPRRPHMTRRRVACRPTRLAGVGT